MHDVVALASNEMIDLAHRAAGIDHASLRKARRAQSVYANALHGVVARRRRDHLHIVALAGQSMREVTQVQLDTAQSREEPIADESDAERAGTSSDLCPNVSGA